VNENVVYPSTGVNRISNINKHSGIQSTLATSLPASQTPTVQLASTQFFPLIGTIVIGTEEMTYTGKDDATNILTGVTRGTGATTIAVHPANTDVFDITINNSNIQFIFGQIMSTLTSAVDNIVTSIVVADPSLFPPSGTIVIDTEEMTYTSITGTTLNGLTRGANSTIAAAHISSSIVKEKTSTLSPTNSEVAGILSNDTQAIITFDNVDPIAKTGFKHDYTFTFTQVLSVQDLLQVKEYNVIGVLSSLTADLISGAVTATVVSTSGFPASGSFVIDNEQISYTALTATTFTGLTRALATTADVLHVSGSAVSQITSTDLSVPVLADTQYTLDRPSILSNMILNYSSISISANRAISDEVQLKFINTESIALKYLQQIMTNGSSYVSSGATAVQVNAPNGIKLPLKISIVLLLNRQIITSTNANVSADIDTLKLTIAEQLTAKWTGIQIRISDADLVFISKNIPYVDDANVSFTDSSAVPVPIALNEINVLPEATILASMTKADRIDYVPSLLHWDVNNINVTYTVE